jgi:hypothetical protein
MGGLANNFGATIALLAGSLPSLAAALIAWFIRKPAEKSLREKMPQVPKSLEKSLSENIIKE